MLACLNPCSNGICSASNPQNYGYISEKLVLILVLMEYALRVVSSKKYPSIEALVLILVLMEYALRVDELSNIEPGEELS